MTPRQGVFTGNVHVQRWQVSRPGGLAGQTLAIDGIAGGVTDVIVRIERADGTSQLERLLPQRPEFVVQAASGALEVARSYFVLGVEQILGGIDHLLRVPGPPVGEATCVVLPAAQTAPVFDRHRRPMNMLPVPAVSKPVRLDVLVAAVGEAVQMDALGRESRRLRAA